MTTKEGYPNVGALVMARAQKRLAADTGDADLAARAIRAACVRGNCVAAGGVAGRRDKADATGRNGNRRLNRYSSSSHGGKSLGSSPRWRRPNYSAAK
jgi:hypothetical protein